MTRFEFKTRTCYGCGKQFESIRAYVGGWPWRVQDGNRVRVFCSYKCREKWLKERGKK